MIYLWEIEAVKDNPKTNAQGTFSVHKEDRSSRNHRKLHHSNYSSTREDPGYRP
jgi:hypothetical protein